MKKKDNRPQDSVIKNFFITAADVKDYYEKRNEGESE